jgi:hypothetical protein
VCKVPASSYLQAISRPYLVWHRACQEYFQSGTFGGELSDTRNRNKDGITAISGVAGWPKNPINTKKDAEKTRGLDLSIAA